MRALRGYLLARHQVYAVARAADAGDATAEELAMAEFRQMARAEQLNQHTPAEIDSAANEIGAKR